MVKFASLLVVGENQESQQFRIIESLEWCRAVVQFKGAIVERRQESQQL